MWFWVYWTCFLFRTTRFLSVPYVTCLHHVFPLSLSRIANCATCFLPMSRVSCQCHVLPAYATCFLPMPRVSCLCHVFPAYATCSYIAPHVSCLFLVFLLVASASFFFIKCIILYHTFFFLFTCFLTMFSCLPFNSFSCLSMQNVSVL
jgi:hypothetical protein